MIAHNPEIHYVSLCELLPEKLGQVCTPCQLCIQYLKAGKHNVFILSYMGELTYFALKSVFKPEVGKGGHQIEANVDAGGAGPAARATKGQAKMTSIGGRLSISQGRNT
ncbi:hypothetical protein PR048_013903 [Dryococelus australis]|uniref:Cytidine deaminase n=1 Tax=Dryococelus australis TaxID=614101 RepID=A0ABQ9HTF9_9NEOP|nr:hypothetical protein PR048_013903 [Dryococelus australis]